MIKGFSKVIAKAYLFRKSTDSLIVHNANVNYCQFFSYKITWQLSDVLFIVLKKNFFSLKLGQKDCLL